MNRYFFPPELFQQLIQPIQYSHSNYVQAMYDPVIPYSFPIIYQFSYAFFNTLRFTVSMAAFINFVLLRIILQCL